MLTLTIQNGNESEELSFTEKFITIGRSPECDVVVSSEILGEGVIRIAADGGRQKLLNPDDLPVLINGSPFESHSLEEADTLQIADITITFDLHTDLGNIDIEAELGKLSELFDEDGILDDEALANLDLSALEEEIAKLEGELDDDSLEESDPTLEEFEWVAAEELEPEPAEAAEVEVEEEEPAVDLAAMKIHPGNMLDDTLSSEHIRTEGEDYSQYEDELVSHHEGTAIESWSQQTEGVSLFDEEQPHPLRRMLLVALVVIAMTAVLGGGTLYSIRRNNAVAERMAAQGLADIAMAVSHAKIRNHSAPDGRWNDADFLDHQLAELLSSKYRAQSQLDANGQLRHSPYTVRMAYDSDEKRFLITATPQAGIVQSLVPKSSLFAELPSMRIYRTAASKQELATARQQIRAAGEDAPLKDIMKKSEALSLYALASPELEEGFAPPTNLDELVAGANTRIHNAPRYYRFAKPFLETASRIATGDQTQSEMQLLQKTLNNYRQYPDLVFYSPKGKTAALESYYTLKNLLPDEKLLLGFLNFNPEDGVIAHAEIITDTSIDERLETEGPAHLVAADDQVLYKELTKLADQRRTALDKASNALSTLIQQQSQSPTSDYHRKYDQLRTEYERVEAEETTKIAAALGTTYEQWSGTGGSDQQFLAQVERAGLKSFLPDTTQLTPESKPGAPLSRTEVNSLLTQVDQAKSFPELESVVATISETLSSENINAPEDLLAAENALRTHVLNKVTEFLLSPQEEPSPQMYQAENRMVLSSILTTAGITHNEERDFYLKEFDLLMERFRTTPNDPQLTDAKSERQQLADQASRIPLADIITATGGGEPETYARLGQQLLAQESLQPPSVERDDNLNQALNLLKSATEDNRTYWQDVLEARRLLTELPEEKVNKLLKSSLGFTPKTTATHHEMRAALQRYLDAAYALKPSTPAPTDNAGFEQLKTEQMPNLKALLANAQGLQRESQELISTFDLYLERLQEYLSDYKQAKKDGFFAADPYHHPRMLTRLERKIAQSQDIQKQLKSITAQIEQAGEQYELMARTALHHLDNPKLMTSANTSALEKQASQVRYPNLSTGEFADRVTKLLSWEITPNPAQLEGRA